MIKLVIKLDLLKIINLSFIKIIMAKNITDKYRAGTNMLQIILIYVEFVAKETISQSNKLIINVIGSPINLEKN